MMTRVRNNRRLSLSALWAVPLVFCATIALGAAGPANLREQRQKEIAGKSEAERARLLRSSRSFRDLPPAEQENLRRLDRELKEDARAAGNLRTIMDEY